MKLSVIVPTFNESGTILQTLEKVLSQKKVYEIIVVDDGSKDDTPRLLKKFKQPKIILITHIKNLGKGAAIRSGIKAVKGDYLIIQDGDLEYDPGQFGILIKYASPETVVYGSRLMVGNQNKYAYFYTLLGNLLVTKTFNLLYGQKLTDSYTCYKLLSVKVAKKLNLRSNGFEVEAEITAKLAKMGIKIIEVPIKYNPRSYKEGKKIKTKDALKGFFTYFKIRLTST